MSETVTERPGRCPECKQPSVPQYRPFCSKRCADIDLARWLNGSYVIAGGNSDADEDGDLGDPQPAEPPSKGPEEN